jgi:NAD(P)-dependent dehydrogenase (short-subunit alcohol dehydrogenase family)
MSDKTVLITGCSSGIGRATAETFLDNDWEVYATSRDTDDIADLAEQGCQTASLDVTVEEDIERVVGRIEDETGRIDCLVNNAGYGQYGPVEDIPVENLHAQFDVNVYGPHRLARAVLPLMREQEDGTIVNMSSAGGRVSMPGGGAYHATKFALEALSDALRVEVDSFGVDVVLVEPGLVDTEFNDRLDAELDELPQSPAYDWLYERIEEFNLALGSSPLSSEPSEVATAVHDAACATDPKARYTVGLDARLVTASRFLPDRVRDTVFKIARKVT